MARFSKTSFLSIKGICFVKKRFASYKLPTSYFIIKASSLWQDNGYFEGSAPSLSPHSYTWKTGLFVPQNAPTPHISNPSSSLGDAKSLLQSPWNSLFSSFMRRCFLQVFIRRKRMHPFAVRQYLALGVMLKHFKSRNLILQSCFRQRFHSSPLHATQSSASF